jgi:hypothetical protein
VGKSKDARDIGKFDCPACGQVVEAELWRARAGMQCPNCSTGFVPVKVEQRELHLGSKPDSAAFRWTLYGVALPLSIALGLISIWFAVAVIIIALLADILRELTRLGRR